MGTDDLDSSQVILADAGFITGVMVYTDGVNDATLELYDNPIAASGVKPFKLTVSGADNYGGRIFQFPRKAFTGIYAVISGTGASYIVEYIQGG